jgi:hypothetical protein
MRCQPRPGPENRARPSRQNARVRVICSRHFGICRCGARIGRVPLLSIPLRVIAMLDVVFLAAGVGFFVASVLYVLACERM